MNRVAWIGSINSLPLIALLILLQRKGLTPPVAAALFVVSTLIAAAFLLKSPATVKRDTNLAIGVRPNRLLWFFAAAAIVAIVAFALTRDSRFLVQSIIGILLVAYLI